MISRENKMNCLLNEFFMAFNLMILEDSNVN